jgi:hypothetical protein
MTPPASSVRPLAAVAGSISGADTERTGKGNLKAETVPAKPSTIVAALAPRQRIRDVVIVFITPHLSLNMLEA